MSGILPANGVIPGQTQNGLPDAILGPDCDNLYYAPRCNPRLDPFAMNAVIAEILNAVNADGSAYDCTRLDNLAQAIERATQRHVIAANREMRPPADMNLPVYTGSDPALQYAPLNNGTITIPNSHTETIKCAVNLDWHYYVTDPTPGGSSFFAALRMFSDAARTTQIGAGRLTPASHVVGLGAAPTDFGFADQTGTNMIIDVPPGGYQIWYSFCGSGTSAGMVLGSVVGYLSAYGVSYPAGTVIDV